MKKIIIIVVVLAVVAAGAGYVLGWWSLPNSSTPTVSAPSPIVTQPAAATQPAQATTTGTGTASPPAQTTTSSTTPPPTTTTAAAFVKFDFGISDISGSGLTRTVTAVVSNLGNEDAHHVTGVVQVTQNGSVVKINGQQSLTVEIGTLPAGTTVTVQQDISFSVLDGLRIQSSGADFTITLHADEATDTFTQFYQP